MAQLEVLTSSPGSVQCEDVASKVLRRARVSKMTRALQDRLALANIKISRGWEHRSIDSIEPELEQELKRKRTSSNADLSSDSASVVSARCFSSGNPASSPITNPVFSDDLLRSGSSHGSHGSSKRRKMVTTLKGSSAIAAQPRPMSHTSHLPRLSTASWKSAYNLPESSPIRKEKPSRITASFVSETSTILDSSPSVSEDDDQDIPLHSFNYPALDTTQISSSPPRTPSPDVSRSAHLRSKTLNSSPKLGVSQHPGKEGADLLLYLASSPSPAVHGTKTPRVQAPSTPPARNTPLPSSMMTTPGGQALFGFGPHTPSNGFNFADFVNVTPSPAQAAFSRTPGQLKTPVAARDALRRLNADGGAPSPRVAPSIRADMNRRNDGLGMQLGGEL